VESKVFITFLPVDGRIRIQIRVRTNNDGTGSGSRRLKIYVSYGSGSTTLHGTGTLLAYAACNLGKERDGGFGPTRRKKSQWLGKNTKLGVIP
jgi:hypothetical protein